MRTPGLPFLLPLVTLRAQIGTDKAGNASTASTAFTSSSARECSCPRLGPGDHRVAPTRQVLTRRVCGVTGINASKQGATL
jgi:hypothetical protein